ncbi:penicillin-binding protein 4* [bacterium BMS3Abin04]|nr:penicillin-binding protein 4* [bacterium BMS3Abin04]
MNKHVFNYVLLILFTGFLFISCKSTDYTNSNSDITETGNNDKFEKVDSLMNTAIRDSVFPGATLLVGNKSGTIYEKAYGHYTYDTTSPRMTLNTIFDLASVSKVIGTTSAAMILYDRGKLKLDEKVATYLPEFGNHGKEKITVRNLLLHNSGLPAFKKYYDIYNTSKQVINDIMNTELIYEPGTKYVYSDLGMITLQKVIERISGTTLDKFLEKNLFKPLGMNSTMYNPPPSLKQKCAPTEIDTFYRMRPLQGEVHDERAYMLGGVAGHAGLFSTAPDLAKFFHMMLNGGKYNGKQIIKESTINKWTTRQSDQSSRGIGWDTKSVKGYSSFGTKFSSNSYGHTGYTGTSVWVNKDTGIFVILLTNRVYPTRKNRKIIKFRPIIHDAIYEALYSK